MHWMKQIRFFLILFVACFPSCALFVWAFTTNKITPLEARTMICDVSIRGGVTFQPKGRPFVISEALARLALYPRNTFLQRVVGLDIRGSPEPFVITGSSTQGVPTLDVVDNHFLLQWQDPGSSAYFNLDATVETSNAIVPVYEKVQFPMQGRMTTGVPVAFLRESLIANQSREIQMLAQQLVAGQDDLYHAVYALADWVNANVQYSLHNKGKNIQSASELLRSRAGKCDETTALFISLNRAVGIPARFVHGHAYTNDKELHADPWGGHAWAEVFFPGAGWIPFDVTYGMYGYLTAGHILLGVSEDANDPTIDCNAHGMEFVMHLEELNATVEPRNIVPDHDNNHLIELYLDPSHDHVGFGSAVVIVATLRNPQDYYVSTKLQFTLAQDTELIMGGPTTNVLLNPGEVRQMHYVVQVPGNLQSDYTYYYPFSLSATFGREAETMITVKEEAAMFQL